MRRILSNDPRDIQLAIDDLDREIRRLKADFGELEVPTGAPRVPVGREAKIYFDEVAGKLVVVTRAGTSYWSKD